MGQIRILLAMSSFSGGGYGATGVFLAAVGERPGLGWLPALVRFLVGGDSQGQDEQEGFARTASTRDRI